MKHRPIAVTIRNATLFVMLAAAGLAVGMPTAQAANKPSTKPSAEKSVEAAPGPLPANAVARVNNVVITQAQLDDAVRASNAPDTPTLRASIKNQMIARELFRQAAEKQHYESRPQVVAAVEQAKSAAMTAAYLRDQVKPAPVTDADVKAKYDAIVATLGEFEYKPSAIAVKDADTAQTVLTQLKKGTDFAQLAKQYSQGPGAAQGGALNWISFRTPIQPGNTQNWPQPLAEALVKLPQGGVSSAPVQVGDAFWILRVDEKRPTQVPQYDQIKDTLRKQLEQVALQKATAQVVVDLMKNARIQQQ
ncbi:peptidyl-prolyl cis-trans isomerase [bacterium M00.F.Ca.ET.228.01.1.1]|uniref:peptidylprolyl isomerase n=1 Tax=Burkholderiaceae TaxID=119060 RepID=UPI000416393D|nr:MULTISPECIES: peptidyl-prolyl cis-trans isomerase [Burkholderiaceae]TGP41196.1 peptidyl-prolyl cis-trans isomerase [bacterium M00.F.Ca.ET.228.01.1.1]TGR97742.1 peptidyl-prolyl cis-trans isomerase [bacterium M00.F.Ca.ET.191.01.1.1]TGU01909.1 peptidyl-prolyl cis-trans isomerase [bacterium M00.F.Ca.ET.155.01.1.1]MBW0451059.1 peptidyl-prolyl cis-trans isomerase [Paraburkholderia phenoliruptrix]MBW9101914.1 peptidyl-prolyl cis-trans isomerase [Paraburkholderia phenoliruptrix]